MKRLVVDARMVNMSGIGRYIRSILPSLFELPGTEIVLMGRPAELLPYGDHIIPLRSRIYHPKEQIELRHKIPPCDLFWSPHFNVPVTRIPARKRVVTIHDVFHLSDVSPYNRLEKSYARYLIRQALKRSDAVITVSDFTKDEIEFYLHPSSRHKAKIQTIHHYVDIDPSLVSEQEARDVLQAYGIRSPFFLYVGNIKPHKNVVGLVKAFSLVSRLNHEVSLVIVGNKDHFYKGIPDLEQMISHGHASSRVFFTGAVGDRELVAFYKQAIALVLPSFYEGFGLPPLEAMACGCPAIVSYIPVFWEVCEDAALYVNPYSPDDIAEKMFFLFCHEDQRKKYQTRGQERVRYFSKEKTLNAHLSLFSSLLKG
ncbi:MAG: glycosyltransferase family 4 protein [Brevinematales bacterium]|nr:glycosyltransferase family 4 protein [Brevinematales bacterium]